MSNPNPTETNQSPIAKYSFLIPWGILMVVVGIVIGVLISRFLGPASSLTGLPTYRANPLAQGPVDSETGSGTEADLDDAPLLPESEQGATSVESSTSITNTAQITQTLQEPAEQLVFGPLPEACHPEHIVLISIDALRSDSVTTHHALPILGELGQDGTYDWKADTINPSITNPGHASMLTGLNPEHHGVLTNAAEDYPHPYLQAKSIFNYLKERDPKAVTIAVVGKKRMVIFNQPDAVDQFIPLTKSRAVTDAAVKAIKDNEGFKMIFIHLPDPDSAGHDFGFESENYVNTVRKHDEMVQQILDTLREKGMYRTSLIIIGSDHAGEGTGHGDYKDLDRWYPFVMVGPCVRNGFDYSQNVRQVSIMDFTPTILYSLGILPESDLDGRPLYEAFNGGE